MASLWQKRIKEQFIHSTPFLCGSCFFIPHVAMHLFLEYKLLKEAQRHQARQFNYQTTALQLQLQASCSFQMMGLCILSTFTSQQMQQILLLDSGFTMTPTKPVWMMSQSLMCLQRLQQWLRQWQMSLQQETQQWKRYDTSSHELERQQVQAAKKAANYATPRYFLLIFVRNDPAITISSLLLPCNFECPAIMMAMGNTRQLLSSADCYFHQTKCQHSIIRFVGSTTCSNQSSYIPIDCHISLF